MKKKLCILSAEKECPISGLYIMCLGIIRWFCCKFLDLLCLSSSFWKSFALPPNFGNLLPFAQVSESFRLSSPNKVLEFFCNYGLKSTSIVHVCQEGTMVSWMTVCLISFLFLPSFSFKLSSIIFVSIFVFVFIFSFVFAFMFLFVFDFVFFFVFVFASVFVFLFVFGSSLLCISPHSHSHSHPSCLSLLRQRLLYFGKVSNKNLKKL